MAALKINDLVINPALNIEHDEIFDDIFDAAEPTKRVALLVEHYVDDNGHETTRRVTESTDPSANVVLHGVITRYKLHELVRA